MNKKSTLAATGAISLVALISISAAVDAHSVRHADISKLELSMLDAANLARGEITGEIIEAELENEDGRLLWEFEFADQGNQVISIEMDANSGQILDTESDDEMSPDLSNVLNLQQVLDLLALPDNSVLTEAELENENGQLIWEIKSIDSQDRKSRVKIDALTGQTK